MKIIVDFCEAFPDGKEGKDSAGRKKGGRARNDGSWTVTKYVKSKGTRVSKQEKAVMPMLDFELFSGKMASLRNWKHGRIQTQ